VTTLIPLKSHHIAYLNSLYGKQPMTFPKKNVFSRFFLTRLNVPPLDYYPDTVRYGTLEILLPYNIIKDVRTYNYLSLESKEFFRKLVSIEFQLDFQGFCRLKISQGFTRKAATILFMNLYNIQDDDLSFSAFYRDYSRKLHTRRLKYYESEF